MSGDLVRHICRAKAHLDMRRDPRLTEGSPVTIHDGGWAYCPAGARSEHQWEAIEPVSLADLRLLAAARPREAAVEDSRS